MRSTSRLGGGSLRPVPVTDPLPRAQAGESLADGRRTDSGSTPGREPEPGHLRSVVGLVWRSVVMWMVLLALAHPGSPARLSEAANEP